LATPAIAADTAAPIDAGSLVEVHTLTALPRDVAAALGSGEPGPQAIADTRENFNETGAADSRLPLRRFIVGGASATSALVAYEQGGSPRSLHATAFSLGNSGWVRTGSWSSAEPAYGLRDLLDVVAPNPHSGGWKRRLLRDERIFKTRPVRRDGPLRDLNVSDDEVREIRSIVLAIQPGSILNISGVVSGCACEVGPSCSDQVWIVAHGQGRTRGLQLSRIGGRWAVGTVQQWWFDFERLENSRQSFRSAADYYAEVQKLYDNFPACAAQSASATEGSSSRPLH
jgi:hypothetical protein